jgi:hypothetical protein
MIFPLLSRSPPQPHPFYQLLDGEGQEMKYQYPSFPLVSGFTRLTVITRFWQSISISSSSFSSSAPFSAFVFLQDSDFAHTCIRGFFDSGTA